MGYGIIFALFSSVLISLSLFYQRNALKEMHGFEPKKILKSKRWLFGSLLGLASFALYLFSLNMEKVSIVQPIINVSIIFVTVLDAVFLKEKITKLEMLSIAFVLLGITLVSVG